MCLKNNSKKKFYSENRKIVMTTKNKQLPFASFTINSSQKIKPSTYANSCVFTIS
jgi:hypothetical protein